MSTKYNLQWPEVAHRIQSILRLYKAVGVEELFVPPRIKKVMMNEPPQPQAALNALNAVTLDELQAQWGECVRCKLHKTRTHLVFGEGNARARLVFVGEGPGADEDRLGRPFVGKAGSLLTDIIEKGFKLQRKDVYITNIVKSRPPANRAPESDETTACIPLLWKQLEIIKPEVICALGKVAAQSLLDTHEPISSLRGQFHTVREYTVMPTYHPAYLLRNPNAKRDVWEDVKAILKRFPKLK